MQIFTTRPVRINRQKFDNSNYFLNADGENYLPFDGKTELETFIDENGERFFCSFDGEEFYNAKGEKVKGLFKKFGKGVGKIGKGVVKAGKFIGKIAKKVGRAVVKASKTAVSGVKKAGGKVKSGAKKLIHHKKKDTKTSPPKTDKQIAVEKAKGISSPRQAPTTDSQKKGNDIFTKELPPATSATPKENIVEVAGKKFDATSIPKGKEVVETIDERGNKIAGVEFKPEEVLAVTGKDGNIEYYTPDAKGMSKGLKIGLIAGGVLLLGIIGFVVYKKMKSKK